MYVYIYIYIHIIFAKIQKPPKYNGHQHMKLGFLREYCCVNLQALLQGSVNFSYEDCYTGYYNGFM